MIDNKNYNTTLRTKKTAIFQNGCNKICVIINVPYSTVGIRKEKLLVPIKREGKRR
ncbi:hypothetical protein MXF21_10470 [Enterococcus casseliflavus]|uniref:hypothetical protein n=1 Tax=Enterococcus casseliflavus TaxID=37734 RepID=UPI002DB882F3|nr:hypothetical protein [Enterococcus casseliflavus]MEB6086538.1 hypothetical protein [Enterococcus casseliflavus]